MESMKSVGTPARPTGATRTKPPSALAGTQRRQPTPGTGRSRATPATPTTPTTPTRPAAHRALIEAFSAQLAKRDPTGALVARSDDITLMAEHAAQRVLDTAATWVEHLGAFYDSEGVRLLLSRDGKPISRQAVHKRRGLLSLTTGSGQVVYPAFQFDGQRPVPGLSAVLDLLPADLVSRWTVVSWFVSPEAELDGERPIDVLRDQGLEGQLAVRNAARRWAAQLAA